MRAAVIGLGAVGGFGCGVGDLENAAQNSIPSTRIVDMETAHGVLQVPGVTASVSPLEHKIGKRFLRRSTRFMQLAILGSLLALEDTGEQDGALEGRTGIILGTGYGATCNTLNFQTLSPRDESSNISPTSFSHSVDNVAAASIAALLEKNTPNITINHFDMSVPLAFMTALSWLQSGRVDNVLVGCVDEFSKVSAYHQSTLKGDGSGAKQCGIGVGEGSVFFVLAPEKGSETSYGHIREARTCAWSASAPEPEDDCVYFWDHGFQASNTETLLRDSLGHAPSASYLGLYGYLPVGLGFALAIAALSRKNDWVYPSVEERGGHWGLQGHEPLDGRRIRCLRPGLAGEWGTVLLEP